MSKAEQLVLLKTDLGFYGKLPPELESYLDTTLSVAEDLIRREGVRLSASLEDDAFVASYAAHAPLADQCAPDGPEDGRWRRMIYDRLLTICDLDKTSSALRRRLVPAGRYFYGEKEVFGSRFYAAMQAGERIDRMCELWRADIHADQYAVLEDGHVYRVIQAQHGGNADGLTITTLTLRREESQYDISDDT